METRRRQRGEWISKVAGQPAVSDEVVLLGLRAVLDGMTQS
jgi:hypothetical protein